MTILMIEDEPRVADFLDRGLRAEGAGLRRADREGQLRVARGERDPGVHHPARHHARLRPRQNQSHVGLSQPVRLGFLLDHLNKIAYRCDYHTKYVLSDQIGNNHLVRY